MNSHIFKMAESTVMDITTDSTMQEALSKLSELEKDFAAVELDARMLFVYSLHTKELKALNPKSRSLSNEC